MRLNVTFKWHMWVVGLAYQKADRSFWIFLLPMWISINFPRKHVWVNKWGKVYIPEEKTQTTP